MAASAEVAQVLAARALVEAEDLAAEVVWVEEAALAQAEELVEELDLVERERQENG